MATGMVRDGAKALPHHEGLMVVTDDKEVRRPC
jgi:hypothetical protein